MLIEEMRTAIHERGWTQDSYINNEQEVCLVGAAVVATLGNIQYFDYPRALPYINRIERRAPHPLVVLAKVIREQYPDRLDDAENKRSATVIVAFNDHVATTRTDIEAVLDKAQVQLEGEV